MFNGLLELLKPAQGGVGTSKTPDANKALFPFATFSEKAWLHVLPYLKSEFMKSIYCIFAFLIISDRENFIIEMKDFKEFFKIWLNNVCFAHHFMSRIQPGICRYSGYIY